MSYRFVKIASYYRIFLNDYYQKYPWIRQKTYQEQFKHMMGFNFGYADTYSRELRLRGVEAYDILSNAGPLQRAWADENDSQKAGDNLIIEQLKHIKPDVVFMQDSTHFSSQFIQTIREEVPTIRIVTGYYCSPFAPEVFNTFKKYDFIFCCSPKFQKLLDEHDIPNYLLYHAFDQNILSKFPAQEKVFDFLFVGSFISQKDFHSERLKFIEKVLDQQVPLTLYGSIEINKGVKLLGKQAAFVLSRILPKIGLNNYVSNHSILKKFQLLGEKPKKSKISKRFQKAFISELVYGTDMFKLLSKSKIGLNIHGGIAGDYAANMRMFEVTGVNSLLLTEEKKNIRELFEPDKEIVTFSNVEECIEKAGWLLDHEDELKKISAAGQRRTLKDHTVAERVKFLDEILRQHL